ncbi:MAG: hypothetical protein LUB56_00620 [Coprobacillus sp.]|nr:hypothetical protein [Coprobacillus sp.]
MSELNGQVLGLLLVVAVFAAMVPTLISLFNGMVENVEDEITSLYDADGHLITTYGTDDDDDPPGESKIYLISDLLSF